MIADELGIVSKVNVKTKESKTASGVGNPGVLAVDYITNNIYFNDNNHPNTIKVYLRSRHVRQMYHAYRTDLIIFACY